MKLFDYIKSIISYIIFLLFILSTTTLLFIYFKVNYYLIVLYISLFIILAILVLLYNYFKKRIFYNDLTKKLDLLDQKYLITELIKEPNFLEGKILYEFLLSVDKSMHENINNYKNSIIDFQEYLELWCHEIKTPLATLLLIKENNKYDDGLGDELQKLNDFVDQVMFYSKSNYVNEDYIIKKTNLDDVINEIIKKNRKYILLKKISIEKTDEKKEVNTDIKWISFIIEQLLMNSIKYAKEKNANIRFNFIKNINSNILEIIDNGIGISDEDLKKVFKKGFTGNNGRKKYNSSGIGLYLVKKLITKLNHNIQVESKINEYTKVSIVFPSSNVTKM